MRAAEIAGLPHITLLEEPQAAFYDWLYRHSDELSEQLQQTRLALVRGVLESFLPDVGAVRPKFPPLLADASLDELLDADAWARDQVKDQLGQRV